MARPTLDPEARILCLAARLEVDERAADGLRRAVAGPVDWDRLWRLGDAHEVLPLVAGTLTRTVPDAIPVAWRDAAQRRRHATLIWNGSLAAQLGRILDGHAAAGIPAIPVKGLAVAERIYGSAGVRPAADLDVLVRRADLGASRAILADLGFRQREHQPFVAIAHEFHDPAWVIGDGPDQIRLELHRALWDPRFFGLDVAALWEDARPGRLLDRDVLLLSLEDTLLHLVIHRTRSPLRLRWVCDIAELLRRFGPTLDWARYEERARIAGARVATGLALDLATRLLDAPVEPAVASTFQVSPRRRRVLEWTCGPRAMFRPARTDIVEPSLALRAFEQDGRRHAAVAVGRTLFRKAERIAHETGIRRSRRQVPGTSGDATAG